ncbi:MAG: carboxymuconolactone decarboxylase family protein [Rhizomicrobium sp.]
MTVRIPPLDDDEVSDIQRELMTPFKQDGRIDNVFRTIARHPDLMKRWLPFVRHILFKSTLSPREREILILRIGWLCRSEYEWAQHVRGGKRAGLDDREIACVMAGSGLSAREDLLVRAASELHAKARVSEVTWRALSQHYAQAQMMDIVFTVGQYAMISMALNSFGVEVDAYLAGYPPLPDA